MPTSEERYSAWLEGRLSGHELEAFELELDSAIPDGDAVPAEEERRLGELLRRYAPAVPPLAGGEFFNYQLEQRLERDRPSARPASPERRPFLWSWPHLAWAAAFCLLLSYTIYRGSPPATRPLAAAAPVELAQASVPVAAPEESRILDSHVEDPEITVTPVRSEKDGLTVVWLDGLDYLPASYQLQ